MRIWRLPFTAALVASNMAVECAHYGRQLPASTSAITQPSPTSFLPVVSTVIIQDPRPGPTDSIKSGLGSPPPAASAVSPAQTIQATLQSSSIDAASLIAAASLHPWDVDPTAAPDVPATAVFLVLFLMGAAAHAWRGHRINVRSRNHIRPTLSAVVIAFCVLRVLACGLRISWATQPGNEGLQISEMIILNVGSVTIYMASAILAQRLIRHYALTSLSGSSWRLAVFWLSNLLPYLASLSSIAIVAVHSVGTSQFANVLVSNGTSGDDPMIALTLLRTGVAWLSTLGALYVLLVAGVVITARTLPRRYEKLGQKLAVFFIGIILLEIGQNFRLSAMFLSEAAMGRLVFYITGFTLEVLVVLLYAIADLDYLFNDRSIDPANLGRKTTRPRSAQFGFFYNDKHGIPRGAQRAAEKRATEGGITIRKSLDVSITKLEEASPARERDIRSPSAASDYSDNSAMSGGTIQISMLNFPMGASSRPAPAHQAPARHGLHHVEEQAQLGRGRSFNKQGSGIARPVTNLAQPAPYSTSPPYNPFAKPSSAGLRQLKQQLEDYDNDMELSEDQRVLH